VLAQALTGAATAWAATGGAAWTVLTDAAATARWEAAGPLASGHPALGVFRAAGLPSVEQPGPVVGRLKKLPPELLETVRLPPAQAAAIVAGDPAAGTALQTLAGLLEAEGLASVLPLVTGTSEVVLVVGVIGLPEAGINLADRRPTGFRWYAVPLQGTAGEAGSLGSRTRYEAPAGAGLTALVVLGYARRGKTDPYEHRVELPEGALLSLEQYEFTMNVLDHACAAGIEVNTFALRRRHVDLDGDGDADVLEPAVARTYRAFRHRRHRGEAAATLDEP